MNIFHQLHGCRTLLRHSLQLFLILTLSSFVQPFYILDIAKSRHLAPSGSSQRAHHQRIRESWEPGSFWWRHKRSAGSPLLGEPLLDADMLPPTDAALEKFQRYLLSTPDGRQSVLLADPYHSAPSPPTGHKSRMESARRVMSMNKWLHKQRRFGDIKAALRHRDKLERTSLRNKEEAKLLSLIAQEHASTKMKLMGQPVHYNPRKHRRAKISDARRSFSSSPASFNDGFHATSPLLRNAGSSRSSDGFFDIGNFEDPFTPFESRIQMFPKPKSGSNINGFQSSSGFHGSSGFGGLGSQGSRQSSANLMIAADSGLSNGGFQGSFSGPVSDFGSGPRGVTGQFGPPIMVQEGPVISHGQNGSFDNDDKDCANIGTKSCSSDLECSCHGFYSCVRGRCDLRQTFFQGHKPRPQNGVWHDGPISFGFSKRSLDDSPSRSDGEPAAPNQVAD